MGEPDVREAGLGWRLWSRQSLGGNEGVDEDEGLGKE